MRTMLTLILVAAAAWSGYWYVGSSGVQSGFTRWFDERRAEGWAADYAALDVRGFPNRFDTTFTDITLADPGTGLAWAAPFFQLFTLSYKPNHLIAVWPNTQRIATPAEKYDLSSQDMRASLILGADASLPLERTTLTAGSLTVSPLNASGETSLRALTLAAEHLPETTTTYRFGLVADGLTPAQPWKTLVDPRGTLPKAFETLKADFTITFDKPWDRTAIEEARPQPTHVKLRLVEARWGQLELLAAGAIDVGPSGIPEGEITLKARNWREILGLAVTSGALPENLAGSLESGLSLLAQATGNPKTLDLPLGFHNGRVTLGPIPIAPTPVIRIR